MQKGAGLARGVECGEKKLGLLFWGVLLAGVTPVQHSI